MNTIANKTEQPNGIIVSNKLCKTCRKYLKKQNKLAYINSTIEYNKKEATFKHKKIDKNMENFYIDDSSKIGNLYGTKYWDIAAAIYLRKATTGMEMAFPGKLFRAISKAGFKMFKSHFKEYLTGDIIDISERQLKREWKKMTQKEMAEFLDHAVYYRMDCTMKLLEDYLNLDISMELCRMKYRLPYGVRWESNLSKPEGFNI